MEEPEVGEPTKEGTNHNSSNGIMLGVLNAFLKCPPWR